VVAVVALGGRSTHRIQVGTSPSTSISSAPTSVRDIGVAAGMLAPTWIPAGETLWSAVSLHTTGDVGLETQLFGTRTPSGELAPGLLVELAPNPHGGGVGGTRAVHVRSTTGYTIEPPKDAAGTSVQIQWIESNTHVMATFRGPSTDQAITVLNALRARDADLTDGFDPQTAPAGYGLLGEHSGTRPARSSSNAVFEYAHDGTGTGNAADLEVSTYTFKSYPGYLRTWIGGRLGTNAVIVEAVPAGPYRLASRSVIVSWPDESLAVIKSRTLDMPTLERIARSVQPLSRNQAAQLANTLNARLAALPTVGSNLLATAQAELHQDGHRYALCLRVTKLAPVCRSNVGPLDGDNYIADAVVLGHQWIVFAASPTGRPTAAATLTPPSKPAAIAAETATIRQWQVALFPMPPDVDQIRLKVPTLPNPFVNIDFARPPPRS
jgi:hypothetical protein